LIPEFSENRWKANYQVSGVAAIFRIFKYPEI